MGSTHFLSSSQFSIYHFFFLDPSKTLQNPNFTSKNFCLSSARRNWSPNFDASRGRRFEFEDEFGRREKRRNWWSDDDDDDEDDDDDDKEFGFWEESPNAIDWLFKILRAFGWIVPAVMVSSLVGTGSNSLIMALVLPLGQTALSLVMEKIWGGPSAEPTPRPRARPRYKSRSRSRSRPMSSERNPSRRHPMNGGYQSWAAVNNSSAKGGGSSSNYGGWDELDQQASSSYNFTKEQRQKFEALQKGSSDAGKLSMSINHDKPLFMRLLIAVFPILGSWTRFLF